MNKGTKYPRDRTVTCAVCGNDFSCSWTTTECCSSTCRRTMSYWREKGIARARARISTYRAQIAELERVCAAMERPPCNDEIVRRYRNYIASNREAVEDFGITVQAVNYILRETGTKSDD
ncbi:hypothetical protein FBQ88_12335 [Gammaproteobacteria bacterium PRO2]|nr:hypothetical protein [Gammaproteobacteria bacterium PRO2]